MLWPACWYDVPLLALSCNHDVAMLQLCCGIAEIIAAAALQLLLPLPLLLPPLLLPWLLVLPLLLPLPLSQPLSPSHFPALAAATGSRCHRCPPACCHGSISDSTDLVTSSGTNQK